MKKSIRCLVASVTATVLLSSLFACSDSRAAPISLPTSLVNQLQSEGLKKNVIQLGLHAYRYAQKHATVKKPVLTIIDYTIRSSKPRMWIIDIKQGKLLMEALVANGKNSGVFYGEHFSNKPHSKQSSLGVYITTNTFHGHHNVALRVQGLEKHINDLAAERAIELHSAAYVTPEFAKQHGRVGRSWGCFAVNPARIKEIIQYTKNGSVIFAYAPQEMSDPNLAGALKD
jgi:hypothetical protein